MVNYSILKFYKIKFLEFVNVFFSFIISFSFLTFKGKEKTATGLHLLLFGCLLYNTYTENKQKERKNK